MIREFAELTVDLPRSRMSAIPDNQNDFELIEQARGGDLAAFDCLMELHQQKVLALAWRMLGNKEDARDAAQDSFLKAYRNLSKFDSRQDFGGWLYRIVINTCRDQLRKRRPVESLDDGEFVLPANEKSKETELIESEKQRLVMNALDSLTQKERAAIVLRDFEGLSTERVAEILGSSPGTVRSQISIARSKIISIVRKIGRK